MSWCTFCNAADQIALPTEGICVTDAQFLRAGCPHHGVASVFGGASRLGESQPALRVSSPSPPGLRAALGWNVALWIRSLGRGNQLPLSFKPALCEILKEETHLQEAFPSPAARKLLSLARCCQLSCCTPARLLPHVPPWVAFACLSCSVVLVSYQVLFIFVPSKFSFLKCQSYIVLQPSGVPK